MKALKIPCAVLLLLLGLSLLNSAWLSRQCSRWTSYLAVVDACVLSGDWDGAADGLHALSEDWDGCQTWLHIVIEHSEIDAAEALLQRCAVLCQEQESADLRADLSDLRSQFTLLDEMERISIKNIL